MSNSNSDGNAGFDRTEFLRQQAAHLDAYEPPISSTEDFELINSFFGNKGRRFVFLKKRRWTSRTAESLARRTAGLRKRIKDVLFCK